MTIHNRKGKLHICHLSLLNPVRHSRIFEKEAISQAAAGFEVTVIGQGDSVPEKVMGVNLKGIGRFGRLHPRRRMVLPKLAKLARDSGADVFQIHSPELLKLAEELKNQIPGVKVVYDMHEDYEKNIRFGGYYPGIVRDGLAKTVRRRELEASKWLDGVFYAERCFDGILSIDPEKAITVENKFQAPPDWTNPGTNQPKRPKLAYTGTIAENWGVFRTLDLFENLNKSGFAVELAMAGMAYQDELLKSVKKRISDSGLQDQFFAKIGKTYVPHHQLLELTANSTATCAFYLLRENLRERIPTRFYEAMALGIPVLFTHNPVWNALNDRLGFGKSVRFPLGKNELLSVVDFLENPPKVDIPRGEWAWEGEAGKMIRFYQKMEEEWG